MRSLLVILAMLGGATAGMAQQQPPRRLEFGTEQAADSSPAQDDPRRATSRELNNAFVRDQTLLGLAVYAPAFAATVSNDGVTAVAAYLVMAGGSFFAAAELTRRVEITEARQVLSSGFGLRGAATTFLVATQAEAGARPIAAMTLIGGLGGTTAGLVLGKGLTGGEAAASLFGHDFAFLSAMALTSVSDADPFDTLGISKSTAAALWTGAGWVGAAAGRVYARSTSANITAGDVQTLWLGTSIGVLAGGTAIASANPGHRTVALALLGGGWLGTFTSARTLVRWYDHTRSEGNLVALGGGAGALMGVGIGVLIAGKATRGESLTLGFATAGAVGGVAMAERYLQPARDEGRLAMLGRFTLDPLGIAAVATHRPGRHSLLQVTF